VRESLYIHMSLAITTNTRRRESRRGGNVRFHVRSNSANSLNLRALARQTGYNDIVIIASAAGLAVGISLRNANVIASYKKRNEAFLVKCAQLFV
jgi:hypothetical protein